MSGLKLAGFKEMDLVLRDLPTSTAKRVAQRAMTKALQVTADAANGMLPKGMPPVIVNKKLNKSQAREFRAEDTDTSQTTFVGSPSPRAHLEEFGTGPRQHKSGKSTGMMPARPFMRPAWDQTKDQVLENLGAELRSEIERTVARRAKRAAKGG
jgi:HK97 gp10 family phage protein